MLAARAYSNCMEVINQAAAARHAGRPGVPGSGRVKSLGPKRGIEKGERGRESKVNSLGMRGKWIFPTMLTLPIHGQRFAILLSCDY